MSKFFDSSEEEKTRSDLIPPDYSEVGPSEDDDDEDDDDFDLDSDEDEEDEGKIETVLDEQAKINERIMTSSPFGTPQPQSSPSNNFWGNNDGSGGGSSRPTWGSSIWGGSEQKTGWGSSNGWGSSSPSWGNGLGNSMANKKELDRKKKVLFIDFLDGIVETYQSNGAPGLLPRDIYDVKPRFNVWNKLAAFNPERVYMITPRNLLNNSTMLPEGVRNMLGYFSCGLASFLRLPYDCCQALVQGMIGQPKEDVINSVLGGFGNVKIPRDVAILIGNNSGLYGQSNSDFIAADRCGISYYDLNQLLNEMY